MTEQEAETFAARLTRIWEADEAGLVYDPYDHAFFGRLRGGAKFHCWIVPETDVLHLHTVTIIPPHASVGLNYIDGEIYEGEEPSEKEFAQEWLLFFRRGCWLSGCLIEPSAHEKEEWIQGFSREELQAWNVILSENAEREVEREMRRVAAAFGVKQWSSIERYRHVTALEGDVSGVRIRCHIPHRHLSFGGIELGAKGKGFRLNSMDTEESMGRFWDILERSSYLHLMTCGLYRLGFEDEYVLSQLPELSAHEKLELRLSMPREFWPKTWLDEETL